MLGPSPLVYSHFFFIRRLGPSIYHSPQKISGPPSIPQKIIENSSHHLVALFFSSRTDFDSSVPFSPVGGPNKCIDLYTSHYDVTFFQGNGLYNHMCKHGGNDKNSFKITCLEYYCVLYDCLKQLILGKYV